MDWSVKVESQDWGRRSCGWLAGERWQSLLYGLCLKHVIEETWGEEVGTLRESKGGLQDGLGGQCL